MAYNSGKDPSRQRRASGRMADQGTFVDRRPAGPGTGLGAGTARPAAQQAIPAANALAGQAQAGKGARQYTPVGEQAQRPTAAATVAEEKQRLADSWAGAAGTPKRNYRTRNGGIR